MIRNTSTTTNDVFIELLGYKKQSVNVLIVGNNPIELAEIYSELSEIKGKNYIVDVCFDLKDCFARIAKSHPDVILIDDNLEYMSTKKLIDHLKSSAKTKQIPLIFLKSSNWNFSVMDKVDDYILKSGINTLSLDRVISGKLHKKPQLA